MLIFPNYTYSDAKYQVSLKKRMHSIFERFYIDLINEEKVNSNDSVNHNKL